MIFVGVQGQIKAQQEAAAAAAAAAAPTATPGLSVPGASYLQRWMGQGGAGSSSSYSVACGACCKSMCCLSSDPYDDAVRAVQRDVKGLTVQVTAASQAAHRSL